MACPLWCWRIVDRGLMTSNGSWTYPGTAQIFWVPPIIPGTGKATDFKFGGYIYRASPNKSPLKIKNGEKGAWACLGTAHIFGYPLSGTGKAIFHRVDRNKSP